MTRTALLLATAVLALSTQPAWAYIGPGMGAGAISVIVGVVASIFLAIFAIVWYPVKRAFKRRKKDKKTASAQSPSTKDND